MGVFSQCVTVYVGVQELQPVQMEAPVHNLTPVYAQLDGLVPGVQQVICELKEIVLICL